MRNNESVVDLDNEIAALESGQDETAVDESVVDETVVDETVATEPSVGFRKRSKDEIEAAPKRVRVQNDADDIQCVLEMRQAGLSYMKIEAKLGWPNSHGNRAWRICRDYALVVKETVQ